MPPSFPLGPLLVGDPRIADHGVGQVRPALLGDQADLQCPTARARGLRRCECISRHGLQFEHILLRIEGPDPGERHIEVLDNDLATTLENLAKLLALSQRFADIRPKRRQTWRLTNTSSTRFRSVTSSWLTIALADLRRSAASPERRTIVPGRGMAGILLEELGTTAREHVADAPGYRLRASAPWPEASSQTWR